MIQQLISSLVALMVAFHAVLGCCAHHSHSHDHAACVKTAEHEACHEQRDCESNHHQIENNELLHQHPLVLLNGRQNSQSDPQHQHRPCGESDCQFVSDARFQQPDLIQLDCKDLLASRIATVPTRFDLELYVSRHLLSSLKFSASGSWSAQTYLLKQVWLL